MEERKRRKRRKRRKSLRLTDAFEVTRSMHNNEKKGRRTVD